MAEIIKRFGKTLSLKVVTTTIDDFGQLLSESSSTSSFKGDLQFGLDLDPRFIQIGYVEVGDAVLYIHPDAVSIDLAKRNVIVDSSSEWEIKSRIEAPELGGVDCHYSYRCVRIPNSGDN